MLEFALPGIDVKKIDDKYDLSLVSNLPEKEDIIPEEVTKLENLTNNEVKNISFLDELKNIKKCNISMIDYRSHNIINNNNYCCFWCRHTFKTLPLGCPIDYIYDILNKKYYSHITKETYTINQKVKLSDCIETIQNDDRLDYKVNSYYITDGIFCSFNCVKSYIDDKKGNVFYEKSKVLLSKMYKDFSSGNSIKEINKAPDWRLLKPYGGILTIDDFRESFINVEYNNQGIVKDMRSIGYLYEKRFRI